VYVVKALLKLRLTADFKLIERVLNCYLQTVFHSYFPLNGLNTCCCEQFLVPKGGIVGGCNGAIDGGVKGQMEGGQIGGKSSDDWQIGFISPLTHLQTQAALASRFKMRKKNSARICFKFIFSHLVKVTVMLGFAQNSNCTQVLK
jgi:hypothetical protein